jgi:hypothetical protein
VFGHQSQVVVRRPQTVLDFRAAGMNCGADRISKSMYERAQILFPGFIAGCV